MKSLPKCIALAVTLAALNATAAAQCIHPRAKSPIAKLPASSSLNVSRVVPLARADRPLGFSAGAIAHISKATPHATWTNSLWRWLRGCTAPTSNDDHD